MTDLLKVGVVGLGMGRHHAKVCAALPGVHLKAISDASPERLAEVARELNVKETYQDGHALIERGGLDAVVIAVPNHLHADLTIRALRHGLHVLVEKPIASDVPDAEAMLRASREANRVLMVGFNQRFFPQHQAAWQYVRQGFLGEIYYAKTKWLRRGGVPWWYEAGGKGALSTEIAGGGPLIDLGVHKLDLALFLMGFPEVSSVDGTTFRGIGKREGQKRSIEFALEDAGVALIRFRDNRALLLEASWSMHCKEPDTQETILYGENGGMRLANEVEVYSESDGIQMNSQLFGNDNTHEGGVTGHFCRVVQKREDPIITGEQAILGLRIIKAIYESAKTGKTVSFE
ncbi:MAG TPA: Gfo/Idh/MocA family oxidoreductase [Planctomycetota bacterium]|nr:Gfo/Idh/MocA family oxidoreductase [Planctomycetota bacterium]